MEKLCILVLLFNGWASSAQPPVAQRLEMAVRQLQSDIRCRHATIGFYVADTKTRKTVYAYNAQAGLAPASTQKLFTTCAAMDLLGKDYRYRTTASYDGLVEAGLLKGNLYITGSGDPTAGSWRWEETKEAAWCKKIIAALQQKGIKRIDGDLYLCDTAFSRQPIPGGWIWEDIGNYYGAGCWGINWHENQYDLAIQPGSREGDSTFIVRMPPEITGITLVNQVLTGAKGSGDNAYIYLPPYSHFGFTGGTVPAGSTPFVISGAVPDAPLQFGRVLQQQLNLAQVPITGSVKMLRKQTPGSKLQRPPQNLLATVYSPPLDSIIYWFLKKSINLYGEALVKTIAFEKKGVGTTEGGVALVKNFWKQQGMDSTALDIQDGSGLSPQNRVTAEAEVSALLYARRQPWFGAFYSALPELNGMKVKSGAIGGARAFAGYCRSGNGNEYTFSIIVNNYSGAPSEVVRKIFLVLDALK